MSTTPELHVIFGVGPLGLSVMNELVKRGKQVRMVNRSGQADVPDGVTIVAADAFDDTQARNAAQNATHVYQCASPAYKDWVEKFIPLQTSILHAAAAHKAKFIVGDNLYMYGPVNGPMHEKLPHAATTKKGKVRVQAAQIVLEAHKFGQVRAVIGRGADFYGPHVRNSGMGERVFVPLLKGKPAQAVGNVDLPHTYTYIEDFGTALVNLGEKDEALGQAWHVPNAPTITTRQFLAKAFQLAGKPPKISSMGRGMLMIGGLFIPDAREAIEMLYQFEKPFIVDHSKYAALFGDHSTPHEVALQKTLDWYRAQEGLPAKHTIPVEVPKKRAQNS